MDALVVCLCYGGETNRGDPLPKRCYWPSANPMGQGSSWSDGGPVNQENQAGRHLDPKQRKFALCLPRREESQSKEVVNAPCVDGRTDIHGRSYCAIMSRPQVLDPARAQRGSAPPCPVTAIRRWAYGNERLTGRFNPTPTGRRGCAGRRNNSASWKTKDSRGRASS